MTLACVSLYVFDFFASFIVILNVIASFLVFSLFDTIQLLSAAEHVSHLLITLRLMIRYLSCLFYFTPLFHGLKK